ncbi:hypothetical protein [Pseudonocardia sp. WMMC193]|uniref:hypothetical protein n=1 Tax=Pseudonocardia sp. WMMC193 TaxID=2911965 RepID=UPI001F31E3C7|nr:hypothetical protein [Pseudonocardia sp. WMMC193]MCF7550981.1 hypothetical protein [Pseudonocardia sp. WMMC193]
MAEAATLKLRIPNRRPADVAAVLDRGEGPPVEECEKCRTAVLLGDLSEAFGKDFVALARAIGGERLLERHLAAVELDTVVAFRAHTGERCELAAAGTPEPLDLDDDEDDFDDEDDE